MALQCVEGGCAEGGEKVFARAYSDMMMSSGFKLKESRFRLNIRKKILTMRVVRNRNRLLREIVNAPSL